ncbi:MAG TPA: sulfotransferase [Stellaceae bacterium]|nr:sulfotransferase [Stellaceae bacterium]
MQELTSQQSITGKRLVFLVGAPRSGTTWLQLLLSASPLVATVNETALFSAYTPTLFSGWAAYQDAPRKSGLNAFMSEAEYFGLIRDLASRVFARILETKPKASVILEKTPWHIYRAQEILTVFPDAFFLHIVRDPRGLAASLEAARPWGSSWISSRLSDHCELWRSCVTQARFIRSVTPNFLEVRYEDLAGNGAATLRRVFRWMGIEASDEECGAYLTTYRIDNVRSGKVDGAPWPLASEPQGFFRNGETDAWRRELTPRQIHIIDRLTAPMAKELGYPPATGGGLSADRIIVACLLAGERLRTALRWRARRILGS